MEIRWSPEAAEDLERIVFWIQRDNPKAAREVGETIYGGIADLAVFPNRGRTGRIEGARELLFSSLPYIAVYREKKKRN